MRFDKLLLVSLSAVVFGGCFSFGDGNESSSSTPPAPVPASCGEDASCPTSQACLATVENQSSPEFALRISELTFEAPALIGASSSQAIFINALFGPNLPGCNLLGGGDTSWLLDFDLGKKTVTVGGGAPTATSTDPYAFVTESVPQGKAMLPIAPIAFPLATSATGAFSTDGAEDVVLPMFFRNPTHGDAPVALTIHQLALTDVVVSATHDCVGSYLPAIFDPAANCRENDEEIEYQHGGRLTGYLSLEELDAVPVPDFNESMCVFITGGDNAFLADEDGLIHGCKRAADGSIAFHGDWCAATNAPATATCFDALRLSATFAASAARLQ